MSELKGACIIGQSGGPTAVINSSALGVIETALDCGSITRVLGSPVCHCHGELGTVICVSARRPHAPGTNGLTLQSTAV